LNCLSFFLALTLHAGLEGSYNNVHPHARCDVDNTVYGVYYNSEDSISAYAGQKYKIFFDSELEVGLVSGYSGAPLVPMARVKKDNWFVAPAYEFGPNSNWGITFGYEFKLK